MLSLFYYFSCFCLPHYILWTSNAMKTTTLLSQYFVIKFFKTNLNRKARRTRISLHVKKQHTMQMFNSLLNSVYIFWTCPNVHLFFVFLLLFVVLASNVYYKVNCEKIGVTALLPYQIIFLCKIFGHFVKRSLNLSWL